MNVGFNTVTTVNSLSAASNLAKDIDPLMFFRFKEELAKSTRVHSINDKRFAHVLGDAVINGTTLAGGNYIEAYQYWKKILEEIKNDMGPLATTIEQPVLDEIIEDINDLIVSYRLLTPKIPEAKDPA